MTSRTTAARINASGGGMIVCDERIEVTSVDLDDWMQERVDDGRITKGVWVGSSWDAALTCSAFALYRIEGRKAVRFCPGSAPVDVTRWPPRR